MEENFKIGDKAEYQVRFGDGTWVKCVIGEKEMEEIKTGYGFFNYRKPLKQL